MRFRLSGIFTAVVGYALAAAGWNGAWMPVAYVGAAVGFVMVLGFAWPDRNAGLRDFLWVSLFFVLTVPSLQFAGLRMGHSPDLPAVLQYHNLLGSWEIDYDALGYTRDEAMDRRVADGIQA